MRPFAHVPSGRRVSPWRISSPSTFRPRSVGSRLRRSPRAQPSSSYGERSHTPPPPPSPPPRPLPAPAPPPRRHPPPPRASIAPLAAPPPAYQTPRGVGADARPPSASP